MEFVDIPRLDIGGRQFEITVPSSKSLANRMLVLSAQIQGQFRLKGDFEAEDIQLMIDALRLLGIGIIQEAEGLFLKNDCSWKGQADERELFLGNSGTSVRFLAALMALRSGKMVLTGKPRMKERPIGDLVEALRQLGAEIDYLELTGFPPLMVKGFSEQASSQLSLKGSVSSQYTTALMLLAPSLNQGLELSFEGEVISWPYVSMTAQLLRQYGVEVDLVEKTRVIVKPHVMEAVDRVVEGDASAATYWWALEKLHGARISVSNVSSESLQGDVQFYQIVHDWFDTDEVEIDLNDLPDASLTLMAIAPYRHCATRIVNVASLRVKETDRLEAMATELRKAGVEVDLGPDWIQIEPMGLMGETLVECETYDDHRIAMSMAVFGSKRGNVRILDPECVAKSYPGFWDDFQLLVSKKAS